MKRTPDCESGLGALLNLENALDFKWKQESAGELLKSGGLGVFHGAGMCYPNSQIRVLRSAIHSTLSAVALMHIFMPY